MAQGTVSHVITGTAVGGAEMMLFRYLRALGPARQQHYVVSMMPCGPVADRIRALGVEVVDLGVRSSRQIPGAVRRLSRVLRDRGTAVVQGWMYHGSFLATLALRYARDRSTGLIWAIHHSLSDPRHEKRSTRAVLHLMRRMARRADHITYCSQLSARQHEDFGFPADNSSFIPNAIDLEEFRPDPAARQRLCALAEIPPERRIIGNVGRAHPMKDHVSFARSLAHLARQGHDVHGVLIGAGQPEGAAVAEARQAGIADRLTALDPRDDIPQLVPGMDVYLLSSAWGEALPLAVAEAMASGVIPVVTDIGDCAWLVGDHGRVCPPEQPELMATAVAEMLALPQRTRAEMTAAGRERIAERMSMTEYMRRHDVLFEMVRAARTVPGQWKVAE